MSYLASFIDKKVSVITTDGRFFVGVLVTFDLSTNIVLKSCQEIIIGQTQDDETQIIELGVYFMRGDCVVCCGLNDELLDETINWEEVKGEPLKTTKIPF